VSSDRRGRRLVFRWAAPKGFTAMVLFLALAVLIEYLVVHFFVSSGLTDENLLTADLRIPFTGLLFTITVSPIFHLIPLGVIAVLLASWTYLTKHTAVVPPTKEPVKKTVKRRRRPGRLRQRLFGGISRKLQRVSRAFRALQRRGSAALLRVRGVSYAVQRLHFARAAVKSTASVLIVFLVSVGVLCALGYPRLIHNAVAGFYRENPFFLGLVSKMIEGAHATAQALPLIRGLLSAINQALLAAAPGFRSAITGLVAPITGAMASLDPMGKYVTFQNVAAWTSATAALAYGRYTSRLYRRRRPR